MPNTKMKAIFKTKREPGIEVLEADVPEIGSTDILVKVVAGSLCGSDVHYYEWAPGSQIVNVPVILGHEFSGEVVETGAEVTQVAVGDRITAMPGMPCGQCPDCRIGRGDSCTSRLAPGIISNGYFAEYARLTAGANIFKIPENVSFDAASLSEPLAVCLNAIDISDFKMGLKTAVLGPGPIGLLTLQLLKAGGAGLVMMVGTSADERRLALAEKFGADVVINVDEEDPVDKARELAGEGFRRGLDLVFEATGNPNSIPQGLDMVRPGGEVILIGIHSGPASFDPIPMVRGRKKLLGAYTYDAQTWTRVLDLLSSGLLDVEAMITHKLPLDEAEQGFQLALKKEAAKVLFTP